MITCWTVECNYWRSVNFKECTLPGLNKIWYLRTVILFQKKVKSNIQILFKQRCSEIKWPGFSDLSTALKSDDILLQKLFWPSVKKNVLVTKKNFWNLRLKAENLQKFFLITRTIYSNSERSNQFLKQIAFLTCSRRFLRLNALEQL